MEGRPIVLLMHSWANKSYCLSLEGEETQFSGTDICPAAETQMTMTPELCVSALQANIIPFAMDYGNGGMDELKKLLLREGDAMKIMALYHCQETSTLKVVMEYATIACVASKTYSDIFKALHTEAFFMTNCSLTLDIIWKICTMQSMQQRTRVTQKWTLPLLNGKS